MTSKDLSVVRLSTKLRLVESIKTQVDSLTVENPDGRLYAVALRTQLKELESAIIARKEAKATPKWRAWQRELKKYQPALNALKSMVKSVDDKLLAFERSIESRQAEVLMLAASDAPVEEIESQLAQVGSEVRSVAIEDGGVIYREMPDIEIYDKSLIPLDFMEPDIPKLKKAVFEAEKTGQDPIPGVRFIRKKQVASL